MSFDVHAGGLALLEPRTLLPHCDVATHAGGLA